jgi:hypothetical protein
MVKSTAFYVLTAKDNLHIERPHYIIPVLVSTEVILGDYCIKKGDERPNKSTHGIYPIVIEPGNPPGQLCGTTAGMLRMSLSLFFTGRAKVNSLDSCSQQGVDQAAQQASQADDSQEGQPV